MPFMSGKMFRNENILFEVTVIHSVLLEQNHRFVCLFGGNYYVLS